MNAYACRWQVCSHGRRVPLAGSRGSRGGGRHFGVAGMPSPPPLVEEEHEAPPWNDIASLALHGPSTWNALATASLALPATISRSRPPSPAPDDFLLLSPRALPLRAPPSRSGLATARADRPARDPNRLVRGPAVIPVPPETVTAIPAKKVKGILAHAVKIPGLYKYYCSISTDPTSTGTYTTLNGTAARRTITGLVSGQGYWIKYCTERGSVRSAWSNPVYCVAS